jgi:two-component system, chemotaxis family, protein-glutamate methylesterase/glutaminase
MQFSSTKVRVLIVDDSSMMRRLLKDLLTTDPNIEIVGTAVDPYDAREKLIALKPDVMTLDIEMPRMDGVTFLEKVMRHFPTRTVIISSLTPEGSDLALRALSLGAVDVIGKPKLDLTNGVKEMASEIVARVRAAGSARLVSAVNNPGVKTQYPVNTQVQTNHKVIAVAASTGGTEALKVFLQGFPQGVPGMLVVQHMPPVFTRSYAAMLKNLTGFDVREAREGDRVESGTVLLAPGNFHMELVQAGASLAVHLHQREALHGVRPSADYLFKSVAKSVGSNATGVVLTGMGKDGAEGLLDMKRAGAFTLAQDEETCVVFGMPKEAIAIGAVDQVLALNQLPQAVLNHQANGKKAA